MKRHRFLAGVIAALLPFSAWANDHGPLPDDLRRGFGFDFYVLALSWSPSWCDANDQRGRSLQCDRDADHRFIVHGLWPQFEQGYPEFCEKPERDVPRRFEDALLPIMPSRGLIQRQWDKHGACSGLRQAEYFRTLAHAWRSIKLPARLATLERDQYIPPDEIEALFSIANPGLREDGIAVKCRSGRMTEVRICLAKDLSFRSCPAVDRNGCRRGTLELPAPE